MIIVSFVLLLLQAVSQLVRQIDVIRGVAPEEFDEPEPEVHV